MQNGSMASLPVGKIVMWRGTIELRIESLFLNESLYPAVIWAMYHSMEKSTKLNFSMLLETRISLTRTKLNKKKQADSILTGKKFTLRHFGELCFQRVMTLCGTWIKFSVDWFQTGLHGFVAIFFPHEGLGVSVVNVLFQNDCV